MLLAIQQNETTITEDDNQFEPNLDYARYLLTQTLEPLGKVAGACGWRNEQDFSEYFQTEIGVSPADYRRWHQS